LFATFQNYGIASRFSLREPKFVGMIHDEHHTLILLIEWLDAVKYELQQKWHQFAVIVFIKLCPLHLVTSVVPRSIASVSVINTTPHTEFTVNSRHLFSLQFVCFWLQMDRAATTVKSDSCSTYSSGVRGSRRDLVEHSPRASCR